MEIGTTIKNTSVITSREYTRVLNIVSHSNMNHHCNTELSYSFFWWLLQTYTI